MPDLQGEDGGGVEVKLRYVRWSIQFGSFYVVVPLLLPVFYCPQKLPWILCDVCAVYWCPSKYMRASIAYLMAGLTVVGGRIFCGWVCPYGSLQDLFSKLGRKASGVGDVAVEDAAYTKYIVLAAILAVYFHMIGWINIPIIYLISPSIPSWAPLLLGLFLLTAVFSARTWCRFICPLGALMSAGNKISPLTVKLDGKKCTKCSACKKACIRVNKEKTVNPKSTDCITCYECTQQCPKNALKTSLL